MSVHTSEWQHCNYYPCKRHQHLINLKTHFDDKEAVLFLTNNTSILASWRHGMDYTAEVSSWVPSSTQISERNPPKDLSHGEGGEERKACKHGRWSTCWEDRGHVLDTWVKGDSEQLKVTGGGVGPVSQWWWRHGVTLTHTALYWSSSHPQPLLPWPDKNQRRVQKQAIKQAPELIIFPAWCWIPIFSPYHPVCISKEAPRHYVLRAFAFKAQGVLY